MEEEDYGDFSDFLTEFDAHLIIWTPDEDLEDDCNA